MKATILSVLLAAALFLVPHAYLAEGDVSQLSYLFLFIFSLLLLIVPLIYSFSWTPLQKGEQNFTPRLLDMLAKDKKLILTKTLLYLIPVAAFALTVVSIFGTGFNKFYLLPAWFILFGVAIDGVQYLIHRISEYMNPFKVLDFFREDAETQIRNTNLNEVVGTIDSLSEVALRSIERSNTSLAAQAVQEIKEIGVNFLTATKSYSNIDKDLKEYEQSHIDKVSFTFNYLLSRLEMIAEKAVQRKFEPLVSQVLSSLGRLAISSASYDLTLSTQPINTIAKVTLNAINNGMKEIGFKSEILLTEVVKNIVKDVDLTYLEIKTPFSAVINSLDSISKELFRLDKTTPVGLISQPFANLKEIFANPPIAGHQDGPALQLENQMKLDEFNTLAAVLSTMPSPQDIVSGLN